MRYPYTLVFIILILWGCSGRPSDPGQQASAGLSTDTTQPVYHIAFEDSVRFGSTDERLVGVRGWANVLADEQNRVYIPDYRSNVIHVFNEEGRHVAQMAGEGRGPGMYVHMSAFQITPDHLYVYDRSLFKIAVYSLEALSHSHTILLDRDDWQDIEGLRNRNVGRREFYVDNDGNILMGFYYIFEFNPEMWEGDGNIENNTVKFHWLNQEGEVISDKVFEQRGIKKSVVDFYGSKGTTTFDFFGKPLQAMTKDGTIAAVYSTEFKITIYSSEGDLKNVITYPFEKTPLKRQTLIEDYNSQTMLEAVKTMELPDSWHALDEIFFDDQNRLWVATIVPDLEVYEWVVINTEGQLLARFTWPRDKHIQEVNGGYMYTSQDDEIGERYIVRYKIELIEQ